MPNIDVLEEIVDAHHHLWDLQALTYPWLMERGVKRFFGDPTPIQCNYLLSDFRTDQGELPVYGSVHVQVGAEFRDSVAETRWLQDVSDADEQYGMPTALVAFCDLTASNARQVLEQHLQSKSLRGVRQIIGRHAEEDAKTNTGALLDDRVFIENLRYLGELGLSFDLQLTPPQMAKAYEVFKTIPNTKVVLCHCGSPWDQSEQGLQFWREQVSRLASLPNVYCKLSGFGMFDHYWNELSIRPLVMHLVDAFGVNRCMFGSNFPVDKLYKSYTELYQLFWQQVVDFSFTEQTRLFAGTAREFYEI